MGKETKTSLKNELAKGQGRRLICQVGAEKRMFEELIAPCGMNCALCSAYLAYAHQIPRKRGRIYHCQGCRPRNKKCAYLKKPCSGLSNGSIRFCYECKGFPCAHLKHLDTRYRKSYGISFIENLGVIRDNGLEQFLKCQRERHTCPKCGDWVSVHNKKCFRCDAIVSLK